MRFIGNFRAFRRDEDGSVSVEAVIWISGLVGMGTIIGQKVVEPLVAQAHAQAALNADSIAIIERALSTCTGGS